MRIIDLHDGYYAVEFPYPIVTWHTINMVIPSSFRRESARNSLVIKFAEETQETAGKRRADSAEAEKAMPAEVAVLRTHGVDLSKYVIFRVVEE